MYQVFVRALVDGPEPSITADILVTVDGLKSLHCEAVTLRLVCDVPLSSRPELLGKVDKVGGVDAVIWGEVPLEACLGGSPLVFGAGIPGQGHEERFAPP